MKTYLYILVMALTTYAIRALPLTLIRRPIRSVFLRSFLYYVPYVTLAVMTFPAIVTATQSPAAGAAALVGALAGRLSMGVIIQAALSAARSYCAAYAGIDLDTVAFEDVAYAVCVAAAEMLDNRQMTAQYTGRNPTVMQILDMHSTNLLPSVGEADDGIS